jgi:hypothetical protein
MSRECNPPLAIGRRIAPEHRKRIKPHGEIVKILSVAVGLLADADAPLAPEHALDLADELNCLVEITLLFQLLVKRHQQHKSERIGPEIAQAIGPYALFAHEIELGKDIVDVLQASHRRTVSSSSGPSSSSAR